MIESNSEVSKDFRKSFTGIGAGKTTCSQREEKAEREETQSRESPQVHHGRYYREAFPRLLPL